MTEIKKFGHHDTEIYAREDLYGKHREYSLCWNGCKNFKPGEKDNCTISELAFTFNKLSGTVTPVFYCPKYKK